MTSAVSTADRLRRRTGLAMLAAAVLSAVAFLAASPGSASAGVECPEGQFCLYFDDGLQGGLYHFSGRDSNLRNDVFELGEGSGERVANNAASAWNNGVADPRGHDHVAVYTNRRFKGKAACIPQEQGGDLRFSGRNRAAFFNNVESYRWVNETTCDKLSFGLER